MLPGSKISAKMEKSAAEVLQLFRRRMAKAGARKFLSEVGLWCLHRVTFGCAPWKAARPLWGWLPFSRLLDSQNTAFLRGLSWSQGSEEQWDFQRWLGGRSEGLPASENRGRTLIIYVPHCSFISSVWLQEILLSLIIEFALNSSAFRFGEFSVKIFTTKWKSPTCSLLQAARPYAALWFSRGKCVVSVYYT